jgi:hypothetical protein
MKPAPVIVGILALVVGLVLGLKTISVGDYDNVSCGRAFIPDTGDAPHVDEVNALGRTLRGGEAFFSKTDYEGDCNDALSSARTTALLVLFGGLVVALLIAVVGYQASASQARKAGSP